MASISAVGIPPQSLTLSSSFRCRRPIAAQSLHQPHNFSHSSLCVYNRDIGRRELAILSVGLVVGALFNTSTDGVAVASEFADMPAIRGKDYGKTRMRFPDYTETESGLQYKDLRVGDGPKPKMGETVVNIISPSFMWDIPLFSKETPPIERFNLLGSKFKVQTTRNSIQINKQREASAML